MSVRNQNKGNTVTPSRDGFSQTSIQPPVSIQTRPTPVTRTPSSDIRKSHTQVNQYSNQSNHIQANSGENSNIYNSNHAATPQKIVASTSNAKPSTSNIIKPSIPETYNCTTCKKAFKLFIAFKKHSNKCRILYNTQKRIKALIGKQLKPQVKSDYICIYCHKQYKNISNLNRHLIRGHSKILHALSFST